ncbi:MAG: LysR substrate-binding domain-containing protein, partial [Arthrobacter sp.]|uniref:LysR substrate-binding domain-containing protein n=1 Tax=Arthrobacter sp. TaxID=1667 RepID=UPI0034903EA2
WLPRMSFPTRERRRIPTTINEARRSCWVCSTRSAASCTDSDGGTAMTPRVPGRRRSSRARWFRIRPRNGLARGGLGLSLLWAYARNPLDPKQFDPISVFDEPTVLVVGAEHPLAERGQVSMADLVAERWIVRADNHPVGETLQRSSNAAGFSPRISFQANDYQEAQAMVSVGLGIALAPLSAVVTQHPGVRVLRLGESAPSRRVVLAQRHDRVRAPTEVAFQSLPLQVAEEWEHEVISGV